MRKITVDAHALQAWWDTLGQILAVYGSGAWSRDEYVNLLHEQKSFLATFPGEGSIELQLTGQGYLRIMQHFTRDTEDPDYSDIPF